MPPLHRQSVPSAAAVQSIKPNHMRADTAGFSVRSACLPRILLAYQPFEKQSIASFDKKKAAAVSNETKRKKNKCCSFLALAVFVSVVPSSRGKLIPSLKTSKKWRRFSMEVIPAVSIMGQRYAIHGSKSPARYPCRACMQGIVMAMAGAERGPFLPFMSVSIAV